MQNVTEILRKWKDRSGEERTHLIELCAANGSVVHQSIWCSTPVNLNQLRT